MKNKLIPILLGILISLTLLEQVYYFKNLKSNEIETAINPSNPTDLSPTVKKVSINDPPFSKILPTNYHIFQTFNNCGPAALSMTFAIYDLNVSQKILGDKLRPYQIPNGDNDDKSVTLEELADLSIEYGFMPYHRPNGDIEILKLFIANDIPVITRTWLKPDDDIGHYRVIKGYSETTKQLIQDDSL